MYDFLQRILVGVSSVYYFTVPRCLLSDIMLLPLYRSLPCYGVRSRRAAGAVLNSDGSDSRAATGRCLINE